ncbi:hypothetical protein, partial [Candidatus Methanarcanum hacksteinii]|uniref:hypothetical protein n=1 Tax=Candidatus Methanarcanum hacksteinii TaxID=2911857 RepID=UPI0037DBF76D
GSEVLISTISEDGNYLIPLDNRFVGTISVDICGDKQYYRTVTYTIDCSNLKYDQKTYPVIFSDYRAEHSGYTKSIGETVDLPVINDKDFIGWSIAGKTYTKDDSPVTITADFIKDEKIVFVAEYDHIGMIIGAGFYEDSEDAKLAMAAFGSTYSGGVDDRTMFIVWEQSGLVGKTVSGFLYYGKDFEKEVFSQQPLKNEDGVRTWLFSDLNEMKVFEKKFQSGTYT